MQRTGNICKFYLLHDGFCFLNGSACYSPFSSEGCNIQWRDIFYRGPQPIDDKRNYEPDDENKTVTTSEIKGALGIKKGDIIGDWLIAYDEIDILNVDITTIINEAKKKVKEKFEKANTKMDGIRVFHNVKIMENRYGIYVVGYRRSGH